MVVVSLLRLPVLIGDSSGVRTARSMGQIRGPLLCSRPVTLVHGCQLTCHYGFHFSGEGPVVVW